MPAPSDEPRTRGYKKKERTRLQLLSAAIDVIATHGEAFTIQDVTTRAGVSNGTFYNYFDDRDRLIDAVLPSVLSSFIIETEAVVPDEDPAVRFATITAMALHRAATDGKTVRAMLRLDAVQQAILDRSGVLDHLLNDLNDGVRHGRFSIEDEQAALDVVAGSLLLAARRMADGSTPASYPRTVVSALLRALGVAPDEAEALATAAVHSSRH